MRAVFFAVLLAGLGIAAPASAVTPVSLGIGRSPAVAVDAAGAGHFVWASRDSGGHTAIINYCRIPPGQLACQGSQQLASLGADFSQPRIFVRPADGAIIVIDSRCCTGGSPGDVNSYAIISTTGGTTWRPPVDIGTQFVTETGVTLTPDGTAVDRCADSRHFVIPIHQPAANGTVTSAIVRINGKRVQTAAGRSLARIRVRKAPLSGTFKVTVVASTTLGYTITSTRTYRGCRKTGRRDAKHRRH